MGEPKAGFLFTPNRADPVNRHKLCSVSHRTHSQGSLRPMVRFAFRQAWRGNPAHPRCVRCRTEEAPDC